MRLLTTTDWRVRRGMLLAGGTAAVASVISMLLPTWLLFSLAVVLALSCLIPRLRHPVWLYITVWSAVFLCLGGRYRLHTVEPMQRLDDQQDVITAQVVEVPVDGHMVTVEILSAEKLPCASRLLLYCSDLVMPKQRETVTAEVMLTGLYSTQRSYQADGVFLQAFPTAYGEDSLTISITQKDQAVGLLPLRQKLLESIRARLTGEEGGLLAGICLGDKTGITKSTTDAFRTAGLPHLLVVSGLHLSVVCTCVYFVLRCFLSRRWSALFSMAAVIFFMSLIGFTPSVVRAGVMCLVMLSGQLFYRRADGLNSMGLALLILLAYNPYCLLDVGLLLSFGAAGGVLCLAPQLEKRMRDGKLPAWISGGLAVSIAATLPICPLLAGVFGQVSIISPVANLLSVIPASVALVFGWLAMLFALFPPLAFISNGLLYLAAWITRWLLLVAHTADKLPFAAVPTDRIWTIVYLTGGCGLVILCLYSHTKALLRRMVIFLTVTALLATGVDACLLRGSTVIEVSMRKDSAVLMIEHDGQHGLAVRDAAAMNVTDEMIRVCGGELDFVLIGDGKTADAARLTDLLHDVDVDRLWVVGNDDWLTGVNVNARCLSQTGSVSLWDHVALTFEKTGSWRLNCRNTSLVINPVGETTADAAIFCGASTAFSEKTEVKLGVLLTDQDNEEAFQRAAALPYPVVTVTDDRLYLITRGNGEWSVKRWR